MSTILLNSTTQMLRSKSFPTLVNSAMEQGPFNLKLTIPSILETLKFDGATQSSSLFFSELLPIEPWEFEDDEKLISLEANASELEHFLETLPPHKELLAINFAEPSFATDNASIVSL